MVTSADRPPKLIQLVCIDAPETCAALVCPDAACGQAASQAGQRRFSFLTARWSNQLRAVKRSGLLKESWVGARTLAPWLQLPTPSQGSGPCFAR